MKWQDSAASRLRQRQNRTFATRASAAAGGSAAAAAAAAAMALGAGGGGREGRGRRNRSRRREAVVVAGGLLAIEEEEYDDVVGRIDNNNNNNNTAGLSHSYGSFFERAENAAAAQQQQQQQQQPSRRRRLRNGGSIISTSVTKAAATAATTTTEAAPGTSSDAIMTLPPPFARNRPPRRSSMPSSFGGAGPTLVQMQAAFLTQRLQQHRERQQEQHGTSSSMMPPPMPREAKRRRSISTEFNVDVDDESGRSTPRRSNSSGGSVSASVSATSTSRAVSNPFAVDLDGPSEFLTEDLLQRTCLPQPGQVGFAEHMAGLFFKDVAASASPGPSAGSRRTFTFSRRMSLPSPQDMSRRAQMTGGGDGGLHHHSSAAAAGLGSNREMMQILRAQHQQLQMQWQAQAEAQAEAEAESRAQQEGTASATTFRRRQQRRSELFTSPGGSSTGTASGSMGISPTSTVAPTSTSNGVRVPPPFAFKYSLSDRSLGTGGSVADAATTATAAAAADASCTAATEGGLQRFKKRPSESIYANNEVEMTDASSSHPQGGTEGDDVVCTEIHSTTSGTAEQPPSSRAAGVAAAAVSVRPTTDTSATSSSSHSISPPSHEEIAAANATVKAPAIRFFNNGVEVNETGVPIVSPAVPAKPLAHPVKIPFSSQAQRHVTNEETDDGNEGDVTASTSSPYFTANKNTANEDEASLSPPLSRSCSVTDVISFAVKRVPELSTRMTLPSTDEADSTKIDDVLKALYDIASDAKSEASPKAPAETDAVEAQQVRQTELLQARLSTTIRSVEGYRRGKAIQVADEKAPMGPDCQATTAKATTAAAVGPHADLINKIFGGGGQQKRRSGTTGRTTRPGVDRPALEESSGSESTLGESNSSLDDMVRDSFAQREKHVDAATALLGLVGGSCSD